MALLAVEWGWQGLGADVSWCSFAFAWAVHRESWMLEDIVFEEALLLLAVGANHPAETVLNTVDPFAFVFAAICPYHLTISVALVLVKVSLVFVATCPCEHAFAVPIIIVVVTSVGVTRCDIPLLSPPSLSLLQAFIEVARIYLARGPYVLTLSVRLSVHVPASVDVAGGECVSPLAMLEAHVPLPLVSVPVRPMMDAVAMRFGGVPLANVRIFLNPFPDTVALLDSKVPLAVVHFAIRPGVDAFAVSLAVLKLAEVGVAIRVPFEALAVSEIQCPLALILPSIPVLHNTIPVPLSFVNSSKIYRFLISHFLVLLIQFQRRQVNLR